VVLAVGDEVVDVELVSPPAPASPLHPASATAPTAARAKLLRNLPKDLPISTARSVPTALG
jgi:hypothetical protein